MKKIFPFLLLIIPISLFAKTYSITGDIFWEVYHITDGDTIKVEATDKHDYTLRILWLDTPEKYPTRFWYAECFWEEASTYAQKLLQWISNSGANVYAELYEEDKYDRVLADVYLQDMPYESGTLFAEKMIRDGYGWVYRTWIKTKNYKKLLVAEQYAKRKKLGLWNKNTCNWKRIPATWSWKNSDGKNIVTSTGWSSIPKDISNISTPSSQYSCSSVPRYCKDVKTREEAQYYLLTCKATKFDRDNDGIACEDIK